MKTQRTGKHAEDLAQAYLIKQGLLPLERNYYCRFGEIDLVMQEQHVLVFVEVRYRASGDFGGALESVDYRKQVKLITTARHYLQAKLHDDAIARIDVIALCALDQQPDSLLWIKNAVEA